MVPLLRIEVVSLPARSQIPPWVEPGVRWGHACFRMRRRKPQVLFGARLPGKATLAVQPPAALGGHSHWASPDAIELPKRSGIETVGNVANLL